MNQKELNKKIEREASLLALIRRLRREVSRLRTICEANKINSQDFANLDEATARIRLQAIWTRSRQPVKL